MEPVNTWGNLTLTDWYVHTGYPDSSMVLATNVSSKVNKDETISDRLQKIDTGLIGMLQLV